MRARTTVASVEGTPIRYGEVKLAPEQLESGCLLNREFADGRIGVGSRSRMRAGLERARLKSRILALVRENTARDFGVRLGDADLSGAVCDQLSRLLSEATPGALKQAVGRELASNYRIRRALEAVQRGVGAGEAYRHFRLNDSQPRWAFRVGAAATKRPSRGDSRALARRLPAARPLRDRLVDSELNACIDHELASADDDYRLYLEAEASNDTATLRRFFRLNPLFQQVKRAEWWATRLRNADIEIRVARFRPVLEELTAG